MINLTYEQLMVRASLLPVKGRVYGVPNGGIHAAHLLLAVKPGLELVEDPEAADFFVDDIVDSGATRDRYAQYGKPFHALVDKTDGDSGWAGVWISFPWERMARVDGPHENVVRLLQFIGEDPTREGLRETPGRVVRSYGELFAGYKQDPADVFKVFDNEKYDEMVVLRGAEFYSTCEHHMLPFVGTAHIAYVPGDRIVGLSKLARLVEVFARRLQVQERLTTQVTGALDEHLKPLGSACVIEAQHLCVCCRGVQKQHSTMITSSLTGVFRKPEVRAEFLSMIRG